MCERLRRSYRQSRASCAAVATTRCSLRCSPQGFTSSSAMRTCNAYSNESPNRWPRSRPPYPVSLPASETRTRFEPGWRRRGVYCWQIMATNLRVIASNQKPVLYQCVRIAREEYGWLNQTISARECSAALWWWVQVLARIDGLGVHDYRWRHEHGSASLTLMLADREACNNAIASELLHLLHTIDPEESVEVTAELYRHEILVAARLAALGLATFAAITDADPQVDRGTAHPIASVSARERCLHFAGNVLTVETDATMTLATADGREYHALAAIYDEGDRGDAYDFCPVEEKPQRVRPAGDVSIQIVEAGPVRASIRVCYTAFVPSALCNRRTRRDEASVELPITLTVSVQAGSNAVTVAGSLENRARDHRLRLHFPLPFQPRCVYAEGPFSIDARPVNGLDTAGWAQRITSIRPHQNWTGVGNETGGLIVHTDGLHEHELLGSVLSSEDDQRPAVLAITLLRSVGWLSRGDLTTRRGQAGPMIATPEAQCLRKHEFSFGFETVASESALTATAARRGPFFLRPITTAIAASQEIEALSESVVDLSYSDFVLTTVAYARKTPNALLVRFFNSARTAVSQRIDISPLFQRCTRVRTDEEPIDRLPLSDGSALIDAAPHEIVTLCLERSGAR